MSALTDSYARLKRGKLWRSYATSNPGEATKIDSYILALSLGQTPAPPALATDTGAGLTGMLSALAGSPSPAPTPAPTPPPTVPGTTPFLWGSYIEGAQTYTNRYPAETPWGNAPWDAKTWNRFEQNAGRKVQVIHYGQPNPWRQPFDAATANLCIARGAIPAIDIDTSRDASGNPTVTNADVASGKYDVQLKAWAQAVNTWGHRLLLIPDVEMNGPWEPYCPGNNGNTAATFVAMWKHMHDVMAPVAPLIEWVWCPNVDPGNKFTPYTQIYPGDAYVDWTGLDGFNQDGNETFDWLFGSSVQKLVALAPSKPILISQTGSVEGNGIKAAWIDGMFAFLKAHPEVRCLLWFNWRIFENNAWYDWPIESSAAATAAFAKGVAAL